MHPYMLYFIIHEKFQMCWIIHVESTENIYAFFAIVAKFILFPADWMLTRTFADGYLELSGKLRLYLSGYVPARDGPLRSE